MKMTEETARGILTQAKKLAGRNYKEAIQTAWMNGNYRSEGLDEISCDLQRVRNTFGPSWLAKNKG